MYTLQLLDHTHHQSIKYIFPNLNQLNMENGNSAHTPTSSGNAFTDQAFKDGLPGVCRNAPKRSDMGGNPFDGTDWMIAREVEKRKIRAEIFTWEWLRRQELEAEVIREMMMEREISMCREGKGLSLPAPLLQSEVQGIPLLGRRDGFRSEIEEMGRRLIRQEGENDGRLSSPDRLEPRVLGGYPFQRQPEAAAANRVAAEPTKELSKGQAVSLGKPVNYGMSGIKRKSEAPIIECGDGTPSVHLSKKLQKEWNCALCQLSVTSEQGLKDHLRGRKHKAKEKATPVTTNTVNKIADTSKALAEEDENSNELDTNNLKAVVDGGSEVNENQDPLDLNNDFKFWCTMCKFGTTTEELITFHRLGKRHMTLLQESGGGVIAKKTMPDRIQYVSKTCGAGDEGKEESVSNADAEADVEETV